MYTLAKDGYNLSYEEFIKVERYLFQCTREEIKKISEDEETPIWVVNVCRAIHKDSRNGMLYTFKELVDRLWGTAKNVSAVDVTTNGKDVGTQLVFSPTPLTEKDIQEIKDIQYGNKKDSNDSSISEA